MDKETKGIRFLQANEIECRVGIINEKGLSLLLFKDARVDQKILDETYTPLGWKRSHQVINGSLFCTVEVWDREKGQWVGKQDVGTESYAEKEKGQASDSFKRACFNWGIGRELYTAPFIWIPEGEAAIQKKGDKYYTNERFQVASIGYNKEKEICSLSLINSRGKVVYTHENKGTKEEKKGKSRESRFQTEALEQELERTGVALEAVLERYHIHDIREMTSEMYQDAMKGLKKSKSRAA